jgi:ferredoxin--NADP+ reductase
MFGLKHVKGIVTERRDVTDGLWIVRVRPEQRIQFVPGQYVTIGLPTEEKLVERPYSVASAPQEPELEFFLEVVPGGKLTPHLYEIPTGGEVYIRPSAKGRFSFDDRSGNRDHFMTATVTGVAPFVSMMRDMVASEDKTGHRITILHAASISAELAYSVELGSYAKEHRWLQYVATVSRIRSDPEWSGERGRAEDVARKYLDAAGFAPSSTTAYLCGNPHMIRNMEGLLARAGFPKEAVKKEIYWPTE